VNDATNISNATVHITGSQAVNWDKAGTHVNSGISDTFSAIDVGRFKPTDYVLCTLNVSDISNIASVVLVLGTDSSNYHKWVWDDSVLSTGWNTLVAKLSDYDSIASSGWDQDVVTYIEFYVVFDNAGDTLNDITLDRVSLVEAEAIGEVAYDNPSYGETEDEASDSTFVTAGIYGLDTEGSAAAKLRAVQVAVDNAGLSATPNVLIGGGIYKSSLDTYDDNDAVPFHFDGGGRLLTAIELNDYQDDSAFTVDTDWVLAIGALADETSPDSVDEGDIGIPRMTLDRKLHIASTQVHDDAVSTYADMIGYESKEFDGNALPNSVGAEGDIVRGAGSLYGVAYQTITDKTGASTPVIDHDTAIGSGLGVGTMMQGWEAKNYDGFALPNYVSEGDSVRPAATLYGVPYAYIVNEDGSATPYDSANNAFQVEEIADAGQATIYTQIQSATAHGDTNENKRGGNINTASYNVINLGFRWVPNGAEASPTIRVYGIMEPGGNEYQLGEWSAGENATQTKSSWDLTASTYENITVKVSQWPYIKVTAQGTDASGTLEAEYWLANND